MCKYERSAPCKWETETDHQACVPITELLTVMSGQISKAGQKLAASLEKTGTSWNLCRLTPKLGADGDESSFARELTPDDFLSSDADPAGLLSLAGLQILCTQEQGWRFGPNAIPFPGIGGFLRAWTGSMSVMLFSMRSVLERKASVCSLSDVLDSMSPTEASQFLKDQKVVYFELKEGELCWIPYGMYISLVGLSPCGVSVWLPWCSKFLLSELSEELQRAILSWNVKVLEEEARQFSEDAEAAALHSALSWLKG